MFDPDEFDAIIDATRYAELFTRLADALVNTGVTGITVHGKDKNGNEKGDLLEVTEFAAIVTMIDAAANGIPEPIDGVIASVVHDNYDEQRRQRNAKLN